MFYFFRSVYPVLVTVKEYVLASVDSEPEEEPPPPGGASRMLGPHVTLRMIFFMSPLRRHIFVCFMAKSAFWRGFSALAPYTWVGPI